jgi:hypothetical protein
MMLSVISEKVRGAGETTNPLRPPMKNGDTEVIAVLFLHGFAPELFRKQIRCREL